MDLKKYSLVYSNQNEHKINPKVIPRRKRTHKLATLISFNSFSFKILDLKRYIPEKPPRKINKIPNKNIVLSNKLISDQNGKDYLYIKAPDSFGPSTPSEWYGQSKIYDWEKNIKKTNKKYFGKDVFKFDSNWSAIEIEKVDSNEFFDTNMIIDLLDFDVQGEEFVIIKNSIELINNKVKRIRIGTHSNNIESQLKKLLNINGWVMVRDYKLNQFNLTPYGNISFCDGVQSWINPRFNVTYG